MLTKMSNLSDSSFVEVWSKLFTNSYKNWTDFTSGVTNLLEIASYFLCSD